MPTSKPALCTATAIAAATLFATSLGFGANFGSASPAQQTVRLKLPARPAARVVVRMPSNVLHYKHSTEMRMSQSIKRIRHNIRRLSPARRQLILANVYVGRSHIRQSIARAAKDGHISAQEMRQVDLLAAAIKRDMTKAFGTIDPWTLLH